MQQAAEPKEQASTGGWQMPVDSVHISSRFGYRTDPTGASGNQHNGIDFTGGQERRSMRSKQAKSLKRAMVRQLVTM